MATTLPGSGFEAPVVSHPRLQQGPRTQRLTKQQIELVIWQLAQGDLHLLLAFLREQLDTQQMRRYDPLLVQLVGPLHAFVLTLETCVNLSGPRSLY